ncbi:MAG: transporter substrate-binding domain-containing protein, partial [Caldilineaceae bacterium]|nr:transporter substrate-binding domain-containing protein [Caldilineaceae bacterium]
MRISLITSTILCALLLLVAAPLAKAAPASQAAPDPANDWQRVQQAGKLVIGTSADYPPFEFYNSNYALDGFDVALAKA